MNAATIRRIHRPARHTHELHVCGLLCAIIVVITLLISGCSEISGPLMKLTSPFGRKTVDESFRKQVQADPFPTAQQAGL